MKQWKPPRRKHQMAIALRGQERELIEAAARREGRYLSEFVREAALAAARRRIAEDAVAAQEGLLVGR